MISGYIVKKREMTSIFDKDGKRISVTKCQALPLTVTQVKTVDKDSYSALQFAYGSKKTLDSAVSKKLAKLKIDLKPLKFIEFAPTSQDAELPKPGETVSFDAVFSENDSVSATGTSKGRGFAGVIKRHGFRRQPVTRGQSDRTRAPGSIGAQTPGKVLKGKKMPGHYGNKTITVSNLKIYSYNPETNEVMIRGSIPGHINSWVILNK